MAQGSIFGQLRNADMSTPPDSEARFIGFVGNTDDEIRLHVCIGAGYENGNWYDDFQNFLGSAPGLEYQYIFFNPFNAQMSILNKTIPSNSYQEEDIALEPAAFPEAAAGVVAIRQTATTVRLEWDAVTDVSWHVYRRSGSSEGSFFRIDNPAGDRADPGIGDPVFVDTDVVEGDSCSYVIVTESSAGVYSPASAIVSISPGSCCIGQVGDVNGQGTDEPTIGDIALLIDHLFISCTVPSCLLEADVNQSGGCEPGPADITIGDVTLLIDYLFITGQDSMDLPNCF